MFVLIFTVSELGYILLLTQLLERKGQRFGNWAYLPKLIRCCFSVENKFITRMFISYFMYKRKPLGVWGV